MLACCCHAGLWLHSSGALGASPDGLVIQAPPFITVHFQDELARHLVPDIVEVKCPYSVRDMTLLKAAMQGPRDFFLSMQLQLIRIL